MYFSLSNYLLYSCLHIHLHLHKHTLCFLLGLTVSHLVDLEKQVVCLKNGAVYNGNYSDSLGLKVSGETTTQQNISTPFLFFCFFISVITTRTHTMKVDSGKSSAILYCGNTMDVFTGLYQLVPLCVVLTLFMCQSYTWSQKYILFHIYYPGPYIDCPSCFHIICVNTVYFPGISSQ